MNKIFFHNPGVLDIRAVNTFGLSAKEGENPIGFFGTGFKYAIAVLTREGISITIDSGSNSYSFCTSSDTFRSKEYESILIETNGGEIEKLPFTTELGKSWELWQAFRELYCNALDEGGGVSQRRPQAETIITVDSPEMLKLYHERSELILDSDPRWELDGCEVFASPSNYQYYRRVRMNDLQTPSIFTYNITRPLDLTEDRTIKYQFIWSSSVRIAVARSDDLDLIRKVVLAPEDSFEHKLSFEECSCASEAFMAVMKPLARDYSGRVNASARRLYQKLSRSELHPKDSVALTTVEEAMLRKAVTICSDLGHQPSAVPIIIVNDLGGGVLGLSDHGKIYLSREAFDGGTKILAGTLMEELIHHEKKFSDMTRELQNFLINRIMTLVEELRGEPI